MRVVLLALALALAPALHADDLADLQGAWTCKVLNFDGNALPEAAAAANTLTFTGDKYAVSEEGRGEVEAGTVVLDATKTPKTIDYKIEKAASAAGKLQLGVYTLEGDTLTYTVVEPARPDRPKEVKPGKDLMHVVFKKKAAASPSAGASPVATASAAVTPVTTPPVAPSVAASPVTSPALPPPVEMPSPSASPGH